MKCSHIIFFKLFKTPYRAREVHLNCFYRLSCTPYNKYIILDVVQCPFKFLVTTTAALV